MEQSVGERPRAREDERRVHAVGFFPKLWLDGAQIWSLAKLDGIAKLPVMSRYAHERDVWQLAV